MTLKHLLYYWINVYEVIRCYGGPEGGGWWYDRMDNIYCRRVPASLSDRGRELAQEAVNGILNKEGRGNTKVVTLVEDNRAQSQTTEVPEHE